MFNDTSNYVLRVSVVQCSGDLHVCINETQLVRVQDTELSRRKELLLGLSR